MYQSNGGINIGYGGDRFVKYGKSKKGKDNSFISNLFYDYSLDVSKINNSLNNTEVIQTELIRNRKYTESILANSILTAHPIYTTTGASNNPCLNFDNEDKKSILRIDVPEGNSDISDFSFIVVTTPKNTINIFPPETNSGVSAFSYWSNTTDSHKGLIRSIGNRDSTTSGSTVYPSNFNLIVGINGIIYMENRWGFAAAIICQQVPITSTVVISVKRTIDSVTLKINNDLVYTRNFSQRMVSFSMIEIGEGYTGTDNGYVGELNEFVFIRNNYPQSDLDNEALLLKNKWIDNNITYIKSYGLQYNPDIPLEALNKRPIYNYQRKDYDLLSLSPLLWLDANDSSTLNLVGSKVALWNDKSGNGYHAIQSSDSSRPSYTTRQEDNLPVVRFSSQSLAISNLVLTGNTFDVFVVASMESSTGNFSRLLTASIAGQSDWNNSSSWVMIDRYSSDPTIHSEHSSQRTAQFRVDFGKLYLLNPRFTPSNFSFTAETNLIGTTNGTGVLNTTNGVLIGTNTWVGDVSQILIFNRNLSLEERQIVEGYLTEQTNLKSSLPTNHPYKNLALDIKLGTIVNIPNWNVKYQRPKARTLYEYNLFDVNSLAPLAWYDASDLESITLVDGNRVSQWADKSGNGWDAIENTASARPTYNQYQQNGKPLITCRGGGIGMTTSLSLSTPYSIVLICRQAHAGGRVVQSSSINCLMAPSRSENAFYANGTVRYDPVVPVNSFGIVTMIIGGGNSEVWYNNLNYGSNTHGSWGIFVIATRGQFNENPEAEIAEIIIFNRRLSTEDRLKIQEYSLNKWGI